MSSRRRPCQRVLLANPAIFATTEDVMVTQVLLPALRDDMARLPLADDVSPAACASLPSGSSPSQPPAAASPAGPAGQCAAESDPATSASAAEQATGLGSGLAAGRRRYLTCCVRLSPEKEPHRFVELVEILSRCAETACVGSVLCAQAKEHRPPQARSTTISG